MTEMRKMTAIRKLLGANRREVDMTQGNIVRHLALFAFPLLVGNLFQQLYNMVDTWVVGNYVSNEAFSAVGTVGPIINMLIGFFTGLASGAGVVISQYFGAKRFDEVKKAVHTAMLMTFLLCVVFTAVGVGLTPTLLHFMKQPPEVLPEATAYLTIYFAGISGLLIYNMGSGILRAVGDSQRPFYFLVVSAVINIVLDLVFVLRFGMGVAGVAYATIIAQGVSAVLVIWTLLKTTACVRMELSALRLHTEILTKIVRVGLPAALQLAITSFSNIFVQSYVNFFGADFMSGWTALTKIDHLLLLPIQSLALAGTTFVGQNLGIGNVDRAKKGVNTACLMAIGFTIVLGAGVMGFAPHLVGFFNDKPEVVTYGSMLLRLLSPFYVLCCVNQIYAAALRGAGNSRIPMIIMLTSFVCFRQIYLFVMANFISNTVVPIALAYPAGWVVASSLILLYYKKAGLGKTRLIDAN